METVTIGLGTILRSEHFFKTLLLARQSYNQIQELENSIMYVIYGNYRMPSGCFDLRDKVLEDILLHLSRGPEQLRENPYLSIKLFRWAWKEGIIKIVPTSSSDSIDYDMNALYPSREVVYAPYISFDKATCGDDFYLTHDWRGISATEFVYSGLQDSDYSSADLIVPDLLAGTSVEKVLSDSFPIWKPQSYLDYFRAVENPKYLQRLADLLRELEDEKQYKEDLITFLPETALDALSSGSYSLVKMLVRIFRRQQFSKTPREASKSPNKANSANTKKSRG